MTLLRPIGGRAGLRRLVLLALVMPAALALPVGPAHATSEAPGTLTRQWAQALGGSERLAAVRTGYVRESLSEHGVHGVAETWFDASGAFRTRRRILGCTTQVVFDGRHGWRVDWTGRVADIQEPEDEMQQAYYLSGSHLLPGRRKGSVAGGGMDTAGHPRLRITPEGGYPETFFLEPATGLPARVERRLASGAVVEREYSDWRDAHGIRLPWLTVSRMGDGVADTARIEEVRWDEALPESSFARPALGPNPWRIVAGAVAEVPFQLNNNHILLRGTIQGKDSVTVVLDSGASADMMLASRARVLGLGLEGEQVTHGASGTESSSTVTGVDLALPGLSLADHPFGTLALDQLGPQTGHSIDAIIGYPLLSRNVVEIDYARERLTVRDAEGWEYRGHGVVLPLTFENDLPYVRARVKLPGRAPVEGRFVLDTGSTGNLTFAPEWVTEQKALAAAGHTIEIVGRGVGGESRNPLGRVERLELGGLKLEQPLAVFRAPGAGRISAAGTAGNIGGGILRRFTVIFDYLHGRLILEPNPALAEPFEYDMSGLGLRALPPDYQKVEVVLVLPNSPASDLGIMPGDEIESLNGRAPGRVGLEAIRKMFRREGAGFQLGVRRGADHRTVTLVTRRLI